MPPRQARRGRAPARPRAGLPCFRRRRTGRPVRGRTTAGRRCCDQRAEGRSRDSPVPRRPGRSAPRSAPNHRWRWEGSTPGDAPTAPTTVRTHRAAGSRAPSRTRHRPSRRSDACPPAQRTSPAGAHSPPGLSDRRGSARTACRSSACHPGRTARPLSACTAVDLGETSRLTAAAGRRRPSTRRGHSGWLGVQADLGPDRALLGSSGDLPARRVRRRRHALLVAGVDRHDEGAWLRSLSC